MTQSHLISIFHMLQCFSVQKSESIIQLILLPSHDTWSLATDKSLYDTISTLSYQQGLDISVYVFCITFSLNMPAENNPYVQQIVVFCADYCSDDPSSLRR